MLVNIQIRRMGSERSIPSLAKMYLDLIGGKDSESGMIEEVLANGM